jgi:uncharacterized protein (TIGR02444 family)
VTDSAFWRFSLAFYSQAGVPDACLELQDAHGVDVNVLLYLLFLARSSRRLEDDDLDRIETLATEWREAVVRPLRQVRRRLRATVGPLEPTATAGLRNDVKRIELQAERLQQLTMETLAAPATLGVPDTALRSCAAHNLGLYAKRLGRTQTHAFEPILGLFLASHTSGA